MQKPSPNFRSEEYFVYEIFEETSYQIYLYDLYGDATLVPIRMSTNMADGNQQKLEFCYKSVNSFFEELIDIKVILFLINT